MLTVFKPIYDNLLDVTLRPLLDCCVAEPALLLEERCEESSIRTIFPFARTMNALVKPP